MKPNDRYQHLTPTPAGIRQHDASGAAWEPLFAQLLAATIERLEHVIQSNSVLVERLDRATETVEGLIAVQRDTIPHAAVLPVRPRMRQLLKAGDREGAAALCRHGCGYLLDSRMAKIENDPRVGHAGYRCTACGSFLSHEPFDADKYGPPQVVVPCEIPTIYMQETL